MSLNQIIRFLHPRGWRNMLLYQSLRNEKFLDRCWYSTCILETTPIWPNTCLCQGKGWRNMLLYQSPRNEKFLDRCWYSTYILETTIIVVPIKSLGSKNWFFKQLFDGDQRSNRSLLDQSQLFDFYHGRWFNYWWSGTAQYQCQYQSQYQCQHGHRASPIPQA